MDDLSLNGEPRENGTPDVADAPATAPAPTPSSSPFGAVGRKVRAIFAATTHATPATAPRAPEVPADAPVGKILIRNCSTRQVLEELLGALGGAQSMSGRYFVPVEQDLSRIRALAVSKRLFVKESRLDGLLVLDLMADRTAPGYVPPPSRRPWGPPRRWSPAPHHPAPSAAEEEPDAGLREE